MNPIILLVEDDDNDAFFLERALKRAGIADPIQRIRDGREALHYLQGRIGFGDLKDFPMLRLVLLDLKLPHVMGLDVLKWIRGRDEFRSTAVVVLSASQSPEDMANAHDRGADAFLVKPSTLDHLDYLAQKIRDSWLDDASLDPQRAERAGKGPPLDDRTTA